MKSKVIILESPSKAKTISSYFNNEILVLCSKGHIRDLSLKGKDRLGVNIQEDFQPDYQIIPQKVKLVQELIQKTKGKKVFLATDSDREGEAIAWHLSQVLKLNKNDKNRIVFNEITKNVVIEAFKKPRIIKESLVSSQETRRILDRIIGFKLSGFVQKIKSKSAGRVQSVALKLIVDLEEERKNFLPEEYNLIQAIFENFKASLVIKPKNHKIKELEAQEIFSKIKKEPLCLNEIQTNEVTNHSPKPFITSTLQQEAFRLLSMNSKQTMMNAQKLYEGIEIEGELTGLITYMRTDSYRLSNLFIQKAQEFIQKKYGKEYVKIYPNHKNNNSQDAHEAIRPTDIEQIPEKLKKYLNKYEWSLYNIIYQRTIASLMSNAIIQKTQYFFAVKEYIFIAEGNQITFDGYYKSLNHNFKNICLPLLELKKSYIPQKIEIIKKTTTPPSRFTEASLIKELERLKIGRPSTYSKIIETLKNRFYVSIEDKKFICTETGKTTIKLLDKFFHSIINTHYTAQIEQQLDDIYNGKIDKITLLRDFYNQFEQLLSLANQNTEKISPTIVEKKCYLCDSFLVIRKSRYGEFLGCSNFPQCKNIIPLKEKKEKPLATEQKCYLCDSFLVMRKGRYGEFLGCSNFPQCKNIIPLKEKNTKEKN
ncbi:type I DNA topoisomerase [Candidatus Phytoplasma phoenicium]|uniref:DNA topoisomerase 1 n=1 Tax=Candidatus Phytoplasma phoenicium TaxID=198422 RepID=A0A2S8NVA8_9MOLU|nr:type I DNA topoisomerase [Candidatus Phytoplasma phoenicium]